MHFSTVYRGQHVNVLGVQGANEYTIVGVNDFGHLRAVNDKKEEETFHPGGNSIDMIAGVIMSRK